MSKAAPDPTNVDGVYQAFWRWHFYAGLLVMPVLMLMALTGGLYLFKGEIEGVVYRRLLEVPARSMSTSPQEWADAATRATPGRVAQLVMPGKDGQSAKVVVQTPAGARNAVYVDPHDARVLGAAPDGGIMQTVKRLHSLDIAGPAFNLLIELVAGWAIVMVATGVVLWWPRGRKGGVVTIRGQPSRRIFWRDTHAVVGLFAGVVIAFLAVTGMPWSAVWGKEVRRFTTELGWGRPAVPAAGPASDHDPSHHEVFDATPWTLQATEVGASHHHAVAFDLDDAATLVEVSGLHRPYTLSIPAEAGKAWSASHMAGKVEDIRTLYLDPGAGQVVADIGYAEFGPAAKAIEWGILVHQGQQFGLLNKLIMLAGCIAVWLLGVSALVMWWKRRPRGRLAAPARPGSRRQYLGLAAVVVPLAILYPLVGASLIVILLADILIRRGARLLGRRHAA